MWYPMRRFRPWDWDVEARTEPEERLWAPPLDIYDVGDGLVVYADLPGVDKDTIDVTLEGDTLTLSAERKPFPVGEGEEAQYLCCERRAGTYRRVIQLPVSIDASKIEAEYEDGILKITLPKAPELKPRKISITTK